MSKTRKGKVVLLPTQGKITDEAFIMYNGRLGKVIQFRGSSSIIELEGVEEQLDVPSKALHLMKYFIVRSNGNLMGELSYGDYNKVRDGDIVRYIHTVIKKKVEVGDYVRLFKIPTSNEFTAQLLEKLEDENKRYIDGVVVTAKGSRYGIRVLELDSPVIECRRHSFEVKPRDTRNICFVQEIVEPSSNEIKNFKTKR